MATPDAATRLGVGEGHRHGLERGPGRETCRALAPRPSSRRSGESPASGFERSVRGSRNCAGSGRPSTAWRGRSLRSAGGSPSSTKGVPGSRPRRNRWPPQGGPASRRGNRRGSRARGPPSARSTATRPWPPPVRRRHRQALGEQGLSTGGVGSRPRRTPPPPARRRTEARPRASPSRCSSSHPRFAAADSAATREARCVGAQKSSESEIRDVLAGRDPPARVAGGSRPPVGFQAHHADLEIPDLGRKDEGGRRSVVHDDQLERPMGLVPDRPDRPRREVEPAVDRHDHGDERRRRSPLRRPRSSDRARCRRTERRNCRSTKYVSVASSRSRSRRGSRRRETAVIAEAAAAAHCRAPNRQLRDRLRPGRSWSQALRHRARRRRAGSGESARASRRRTRRPDGGAAAHAQHRHRRISPRFGSHH